MPELVRGTVADRPWGKTLAAIGLRGLTGQLAIVAEGKRYEVAFAGGAVVAAASPLASDAAVRVALTSHLVSSTQVADIARRQAAAPNRDEVDVIAELIRLAPEQAVRLRRRVVAQRAARTFSIDRGEFSVDARTTLLVVPGNELDVRAVIYLGARQNLSEPRLAADLARLGSWFRLTDAGVEDLPQFGFSDLEHPVLEKLRTGGTLAELEAHAPTLDPRTVGAVVYALAACGACQVQGDYPTGVPAPPPPQIRRPRPPTQQQSSGSIRIPASSTGIAIPVRKRTSTSRPPPAKHDANRAAEIQRLIEERLAKLDAGADHFALLGATPEASDADLRKAYFALARQLHPDRLAALQIADPSRDAQRLFAQINTAFAVLSDPKKRHAYVDVLRRGGEAAVRADQQRAEEMAARVFEAEEAFRRGDALLRRDQPQQAIAELQRATSLDPDEADYHATLAWAQFAASADKAQLASTTRNLLERAIQRSPRAVTAHLYLGRVERMLGREQDALRHFRDVLELDPHNADAGGEVRVLEQRRRR